MKLMSSDIIKTENLTKKFNNFIAVDNVTFTVKKVEIFDPHANTWSVGK